MTAHERCISLWLTDDHAWALAEFLKRSGWSDVRANAVDADEADTSRAAVDALARALADAGYAPRGGCR